MGCSLLWTDRNDWSPVVESAERTVTGSLVVEPWTRTGGRPITLESESDEFGVLPRQIVDSLQAWAAIPGLTLTLDWHGESLGVMFRQAAGPAISARPIHPAGAPQSSDYMTLTLRLRTL